MDWQRNTVRQLYNHALNEFNQIRWRDFITLLEHHGEKNGCHLVQVNPRGTTKECASCGVETRKPLWVREHSCPTCGFETDREWNVALNVRSRGVSKQECFTPKQRLWRLRPLCLPTVERRPSLWMHVAS
jgi:transposase